MRALVTGAAGYVGGRLLEAFERGAAGGIATAVAVGRGAPRTATARVDWAQADLGKPGWTASLPEGRFDAVIHLAQSRHYRDFPAQAADIFAVNVQATAELAQWAHSRGVKRFVFASTGNVYGFGDRVHKETDACMPDTMYGASKLAAEILLRPYATRFDVALLRFFGIYGPHQAGALIPDIIRRFTEGEEITLAGNVGVRFNPVYADDAVDLLVRAASEKLFTGCQVINACGPDTVDLRQVAEGLEAIAGGKARLKVVEGAPRHLVGETGSAPRLFGKAPATRFRDGLAATYRSLAPAQERA